MQSSVKGVNRARSTLRRLDVLEAVSAMALVLQRKKGCFPECPYLLATMKVATAARCSSYVRSRGGGITLPGALKGSTAFVCKDDAMHSGERSRRRSVTRASAALTKPTKNLFVLR